MLWKALLLMLIAVLAHAGSRFLGCSMLERPVVSAALTGLVLGDFQTGLLMAGTLELTWMGVMYIGFSVPSDVATGSIVGTAFAILFSKPPEVALGISIPAGLLASYIVTGLLVLLSFATQRADAYAERGDLRAIARLHLLCGAVRCLVMGMVVFLAVYLGEGMMRTVVDKVPQRVMEGLNAAAGMLPALGFAMLLAMMWDVKYLPYFFIGFVCVASLGLDITAIAVLGACAACIKYFSTDKGEDAAAVADTQETHTTTEIYGRITKGDLWRVYWRSMAYGASYNAQRMQGIGFLYTIAPVLEKLYAARPEKLVQACRRHLEMMNANEFTVPFIFGSSIAMELRNSEDDSADLGPVISASKIALMGPVSAVGDTLFWGTLRVIACGIGAGLCLQGSFLGPVLFLLVFNIPAQLCRYFSLHLGFRTGESALQGITGNSLLKHLTDSAYVMGLMVVGAMTAAYVGFGTRLQLQLGGSTIQLQQVLDGIFPSLLPLLLTFFCSWLIRKKNIKAQYIILGMLVLGLVGGMTGIL